MMESLLYLSINTEGWSGDNFDWDAEVDRYAEEDRGGEGGG